MNQIDTAIGVFIDRENAAKVDFDLSVHAHANLVRLNDNTPARIDALTLRNFNWSIYSDARDLRVRSVTKLQHAAYELGLARAQITKSHHSVDTARLLHLISEANALYLAVVDDIMYESSQK
jgi:hypothetical protein